VRETDVADRDPEVRRNPEGSFIDLWLADLDAPRVGRNLLAEETYKLVRLRS
jgi:transcriptional regulator of nitric oxide reductase